MSTDTPYSDQWRERTRERMSRLRATFDDLERACGRGSRLAAAGHIAGVTLEYSGPVDEWLDHLEELFDAAALEECTVHHPGVGSPRVRRVDVDLGPLCDCDVAFLPGRMPK